MRGFAAALFATSLLAMALVGTANADFSEYGIESFEVSRSTSQAGDHPDLSVNLALKQEPGGGPHANTREVVYDLPPGLLGNPNAVSRCTTAQLVGTDVNNPTNETACPVDAQIGLVTVTLGGPFGTTTLAEPMYNMVPPADAVARLGFYASTFVVVVDAEVRSDGDYGVTLTSRGIGATLPLISVDSTTWGVPADESHDPERITPYEAVHCGGAPCTAPGEQPRRSGLSPVPFLYNPTRCGVAQDVKVTARSYPLPQQPVSDTDSLPPVSGCGKLEFEPRLTLTPTSHAAATPTGLDAELTIPQNETVNGLATSQLRHATVTLPEGVTIAPGAGDGLAACSAAEVRFGTRLPAACPEAAKIATVEIDSPPLAEPIEGAVYQRTPVKGDLFGVWLVADELGLHLKLPGKVQAHPLTGQLSASFVGTPQSEGLPQAPVRSFELHFKSGPRAPLATPAACGTYVASYEFVPWAGGPVVSGGAPMSFDQGCATGGFSPELSAGTTNPVAGAFAPFVTTLGRESNERNVASFGVTLPPGVSAKLAGVALCEGMAAVSGDCPPASRVGTGRVAVGPGTAPLWLPQPGKESIDVFLSGPYKGAPYSLVVNAPAQAGPFDLGTVVTRATIHVDPKTAQPTVSSDPLPQILEGVPISYRTIHVDVDRPRFALNPTSCKQMRVRGTVISTAGQLATPTSRFQVGGCADLGFKPRLSLHLIGRTTRGGHPRLRAVLRPRKGDANIARTNVTLPLAVFLDQAHIRTICTRVQFAQDRCPKGSVYGHATARTPLLGEPLSGPVYLRSSSNPLPDLVAALAGPVEIEVAGRIDSVKGRGIRTVFAAVPDAPVTKFVLTMRGGAKGLLVNSRNLCKRPVRAQLVMDAHSGKRRKSNPILQNDCARKARNNSPRSTTKGRE
jgi:hypothetical protein